MHACREARSYTHRQIADKMSLTPAEYVELETSDVTMTAAHAEKLATIYNIDKEHFLESSQQLELLYTRVEVIKKLKAENEIYKKYMEASYNLLMDFEIIHTDTENRMEANNKTANDEQDTPRQ